MLAIRFASKLAMTAMLSRPGRSLPTVSLLPILARDARLTTLGWVAVYFLGNQTLERNALNFPDQAKPKQIAINLNELATKGKTPFAYSGYLSLQVE